VIGEKEKHGKGERDSRQDKSEKENSAEVEPQGKIDIRV